MTTEKTKDKKYELYFETKMIENSDIDIDIINKLKERFEYINNECREANYQHDYYYINDCCRIRFLFELDREDECYDAAYSLSLDILELITELNEYDKIKTFYYIDPDLRQLTALINGRIRILNRNRPEAMKYRIENELLCNMRDISNNIKTLYEEEIEEEDKIVDDLEDLFIVKVEQKEKESYRKKIRDLKYKKRVEVNKRDAEERMQDLKDEASFWGEMSSLGISREDIYD